MSHFIGLVINTPQYLENHDLEDALAPYDEKQVVPEYVAETVNDYEKVRFLAHYAAGFDAEEELYEKFKTIAEKEGRSLNNLAEHIIRQYVSEYEAQHGTLQRRD